MSPISLPLRQAGYVGAGTDSLRAQQARPSVQPPLCWLPVTLVREVAFILYGEAYIRQVLADHRVPQDSSWGYLLTGRDARSSDCSEPLLRATARGVYSVALLQKQVPEHKHDRAENQTADDDGLDNILLETAHNRPPENSGSRPMQPPNEAILHRIPQIVFRLRNDLSHPTALLSQIPVLLGRAIIKQKRRPQAVHARLNLGVARLGPAENLPLGMSRPD